MIRKNLRRVALCAVGTAAANLAAVSLAAYRIERVASGLNEPVYVTQAPGDSANLYIVERISSIGAGAVGSGGRILKYNLATRQKTTVLSFPSSRVVRDDAGMLSMAFSPDFAIPGSPGFQKFYLSSCESPKNQLATNRVEEYSYAGSGVATLSKVVLQYTQNVPTNAFRTVNWVGFDPTAAGGARNYLYITTGDGGPEASVPGYVAKAQDLNEVYGKVLRVDVAGADAYPADPNKNFAIPPTNPIPAAAGSGLGEVIASGVRNPWKASFDRQTGDFYLGDGLGYISKAEIDFLKAGSLVPGTPTDFGWPRREGTDPDSVASLAGPQGASLNPILERPHTATDDAWVGGYVYRGPVAELQGKYLFGDITKKTVYTLDFGRSTDPSTFNGANGALTDVTSLFNSLVVDPLVPGYTPSIGQLFGIDLVSSFGEDNEGNVYIVDFGYIGDLGEGEVFRITSIVPEPTGAALAAAELGIVAAGSRSHRRRLSRSFSPSF